MNPALYFSEISVGKMFHYNGNDYTKQSTRTGKMLSNGRAFYIQKNAVCHLVRW